jgi:hypothetical protein
MIIEIFGQIMVNFDYKEFSRTHPRLLKAIHAVMEASSVQGQFAQMPRIDKESLKRRINNKN